MKRYCLALDLKNDPLLISKYIDYHKQVWPEISSSIKENGIIDMQIYNFADRLFMIIETEDDFSFEKKNKRDSHNPFVIKWEEIMSKFQKPISISDSGEKWMLMEKIYELEK
ncbi:L-rhamnose mutarotase [Flavobacteriaceae bacterium]|jgi:L-rhamnose mutarotase|nr:L-rhamnose mutarotase [Flavobacteriaceae bacterium]